MTRMLSLCLALFFILAPTCHVEPIAECIDLNADGTYTGHFGYDASGSITIPIGYQNRFVPYPRDRGQGTYFRMGRVADHVTATVPIGSTVTWHLDGNYATLTAESIKCNPTAVVVEGVSAYTAVQVGLVFGLVAFAVILCVLVAKRMGY